MRYKCKVLFTYFEQRSFDFGSKKFQYFIPRRQRLVPDFFEAPENGFLKGEYYHRRLQNQ